MMIAVSYTHLDVYKRQAIINLIPLQPDEKITAMIPIKEYEDDKYLFMATRNGIVKKTPIKDYENIRKNGLAAINLREDDKLIEVKVTDNSEDILLFTKFGQCIRFKETDVRSTGRTTTVSYTHLPTIWNLE